MMMTADVAMKLIDIADGANRLSDGVAALVMIGNEYEQDEPRTMESKALNFVILKLGEEVTRIQAAVGSCLKPNPAPAEGGPA